MPATARAASRAAARLLPWPADRPLRAWQSEAAEAVFAHPGSSFLASATPAAGKTTFGLHVAHRMLAEGRVSRVVIAAPTTHICRQWAADAARYGIDLEPNRPNSAGPEPRDRHGVAVTYQTIAAGPGLHRRRCAQGATLLIADEPHHMGEQAAWGRNMLAAFDQARFRLLLSGTPFRSDNTAIPWVRYDDGGVSSADFSYGYTDALLDGVCRPVTFHPYEGDMEWMSDGRRRSADFAVVLPAAEAARRLRTALDPHGDWIGQVLRDANERLMELRAVSHPTAGALVVAIDKEHAEILANRLGQLTGTRPQVVTSDASDASARIAAFAAGSDPWLVSVLMVSEGVDIPRLRVGVYATTARTELFFRQVVGRFIRRTPAPRAQMSHLYMPADPRLKVLAGEIEQERNHALDMVPKEPTEDAERVRTEPTEAFRALSASARPDDVVLQTTKPGDALQLFGDPTPTGRGAAEAAVTSFSTGSAAPAARADEDPFSGVASVGTFGVPAAVMGGGSEPDGVTPSSAVDAGLRAEAAGVPATRADAGDAIAAARSRPPGETAHERRERLREERRELVATRSRQTGEPHRAIHARLNRATGASSVANATALQLEKANRLLRREIEKRT